MPTHNPPGFYPFWFWNDTLNEKEIRWQIAQMAEQGIRGFFIHPRQGLKQPYLSDAFFDMVEVAIHAAEQHNMLVHLYDEYPYPSGIAGGEVTEGNPHFQGTRLTQRKYDTYGGPIRKALPRGNVLSCIAYPVKNDQVDWNKGIDLRSSVGMVLADASYNVAGLTQYNQKRYFASNPVPTLETILPEGTHRIFVSVQTQITTHKYWGYYTDIMNPEAVQHYINLTHGRYYNRFADKFGNTIRSIFVDETLPSWSTLLPQAFQTTYGYNLIPLLHALQDPAHPKHLQVTKDYHQLQYEHFLNSYDKPMQKWCEEHGIAYSGEKGSMRLSQLQYMHIPGCDPGHTKAGAEELDTLTGDTRRSAKATASAAYFYNKEGALDECYHSLGWSGTVQDAKFIAESLILMDIRYLVPHGFFYSTHALKKHDAPPTFFFQMPYWPLWKNLSDHINKLYEHFEGTHIPAETLLIDHATVLPTSEDIKTDDTIRNTLIQNQLDFLIVDTDILESGTIENGHVHIKDIAAKLVICPPGRHIEEPLANWLAAFEKQGGHVLHIQRDDSPNTMCDQILNIVQPHLNVRATSGDLTKLQLVTRTNGDRTLHFLINTGSDTLQLIFDQPLNEIPLSRLPVCLHNNQRTLAPFESTLLEAVAPISIPELPQITIPITGETKVTPKDKNLLRLYDWDMSLLDPQNNIIQTETVPAIPITNQLAHGNFRFTPQIDMQFGIMPNFSLPELRVRYTTTFENTYDGRVELVMEPESLMGEWAIRVNDSDPLVSPEFAQLNAHVRGSLGTNITPFIQQGTNTITIDLITHRPDGGLVNPLYLAGDFAVNLNPISLCTRPETGGFETYEQNGLPFYAGIIEYEMLFTLDAIPDGNNLLANLTFEDTFLEACEIAINDSDYQPLLWSPYTCAISRNILNQGVNTAKIRVYTSLIRSFEGQRFDHDTHTYHDIG
ncbi:MAG: hypothetical protein HN521_10735 [Candidatus Latescibacteria bacterium]|nr:hypothetical protein [Candidatus Latescibacterota bacterium]